MPDELGEDAPWNFHPAARELYARQAADDMLDERGPRATWRTAVALDETLREHADAAQWRILVMTRHLTDVRRNLSERDWAILSYLTNARLEITAAVRLLDTNHNEGTTRD